MIFQPNFFTEIVSDTPFYGKFVISPLPAGFGHTIGHSLRRTLLSALSGAAATYVKINNAVHPFMTIPGIKESVLDIILNIKLLRFKVTGEGPFEISLSAKGKGKVLAKDLKSGDVGVVNKDLYLAEVTDDKVKLDIKIIVEKGIGYSPAEEREKKEFGLLPVDAVFSPVTKVNYAISGARIGRRTTYDKLTLEIWTDGSLAPSAALKQCGAILSSSFSHILSGRDVKKEEDTQKETTSVVKDEVDKKVYQTIIDELDLPTRVINALLREKIETVKDLISRKKENLVDLKGVGKKSLDLIEKELEKLGVPFE